MSEVLRTDLSEAEVKLDHLLTLSQLKYELGLPKPITSEKRREEIIKEMTTIIEENNMYPYLKYLEKENVGFPKLDEQKIQAMKKVNEEKLKVFDEKVKDAEEHSGENEVREALLAKSTYLHEIGDKEAALSTYRLANNKTVALGQRLDIVFGVSRVAFGFFDHDLVKRQIEVAKSMIEEGGDWERRNRLKVYEGTYLMGIRDFAAAAKLFLESVSTFSSYELMSYNKFVFYAIICSIISLERPELKKKVIDSSDVLTIIKQIPHAQEFLTSLYNCQYSQFLLALANTSDEMKKDRFLGHHVRFYSREMRIRGYTQFLESYKSVTLDSMARQFGLSVAFLDKELSRFIAAGRLNARIDKVGGIVESNQRDQKNTHYQAAIKHGDLLLNRVQKLSRVIDL